MLFGTRIIAHYASSMNRLSPQSRLWLTCHTVCNSQTSYSAFTISVMNTLLPLCVCVWTVLKSELWADCFATLLLPLLCTTTPGCHRCYRHAIIRSERLKWTSVSYYLVFLYHRCLSVIMGDYKPAEALTHRRRATLAVARAATLQPMNRRFEGDRQSLVAADISFENEHNKHDHSLEISRNKTKNDKKKRRNDISDMLRWAG